MRASHFMVFIIFACLIGCTKKGTNFRDLEMGMSFKELSATETCKDANLWIEN